MSTSKIYDYDEVSCIVDKGDLGYIDFDNNLSLRSYDTNTEGPIVISIPFPYNNEKPQSVLLGHTMSDKITITNTTKEPMDLWSVNIYDSNPKDSFTVSLMEPPSENSDEKYVQGFYETFCLEDRVLQPEQTLTVWLSCKPKDTGMHTTAVHFDVGDKVIERLVCVLVDDKISRLLVSNKPYCRDRRKEQLVVDRSAKDTYVSSICPTKGISQVHKFRLDSYPVMEEVRKAVQSNNSLPKGVTNGLTRETYQVYFSTLLNMEEVTQEVEMRDYSMEFVSFGRKGLFLTLEVPGLAEKRPSLVFGDYVFAKLAFDDAYDSTPPYQGHIHRVKADEVYLKFSEDFHFAHRYTNLYNVQFNFNRVNMRKLYQALEATKSLDSIFLFPSNSTNIRKTRPIQLRPFPQILNEEQKLAIKMIIGCRGGAPYMIIGPPGTGKTVTIIEAVIQLYKERNNTRILVCAPSNSAADNILEMLIQKLGEYETFHNILRLNATTRPVDDMKQEYLRFCHFKESSFWCPELWEFMRCRIIISTYMSCFYMKSEGVTRGTFSHIFLDEAGQASEPETMVAVSNFCGKDTVVVLAGDPNQLGPVVHSKDAENFGLSISFLERLYGFGFYESRNENYVMKLVRNYRCHPKILSLPSRLFYNGELIAMKTEDSSLAKWADLLPNKEFPVLFVGIQGCDEREGNNPSWFNRFEVSKVVEIVRNLIGKGVNGEDIGVIAPYRQQVLKVRYVLESLGCSRVKVGSVEQFQGQERKVIIISTVRSTIKHIEFDKIHYLGFLSNWRRFNVAITRAMSLLIIIGNPHIIGKDKYWNMLLWHCVENGSYQGCCLPEKESFAEECPTQEKRYWDDIEDQESNTQGGDVPFGIDITQASENTVGCTDLPYNIEWESVPNDIEWGDSSCYKDIQHGSEDVDWGDSSYGENIPQGSNDGDGGWGERQANVFDSTVPQE